MGGVKNTSPSPLPGVGVSITICGVDDNVRFVPSGGVVKEAVVRLKEVQASQVDEDPGGVVAWAWPQGEEGLHLWN